MDHIEDQQIVSTLDAWSRSVDDTATGKTLAALKGSVLEPDATGFLIMPGLTTDNVRYNLVGTAAANSTRLNYSTVLTLTANQAATARFFSSKGAKLNVREVVTLPRPSGD